MDDCESAALQHWHGDLSFDPIHSVQSMIGLDIGGANLKVSDGVQCSRSVPFAIWKHPDRLSHVLQELLSGFPDASGFAVTMTAELADCFATKQAGVNHILDAVEQVAAGRLVMVWQTGGEFVTTAEAREFPRLVSAANWHALATWSGRMVDTAPGLLIDIGSTTTDLIPLIDGLPVTQGLTDVERLSSGELVYVGVRRTPLCALAASVPLRSGRCGLAAEWFATTLDLFLLTGEVPEDPHDTETADGRPATISAAHSRVAHLVGCDAEELTLEEAIEIAATLKSEVTHRISQALTHLSSLLPSRCQTILTCGEGEFLAREVARQIPMLAEADVISLTSALGPDHSQAACAFALARLGQERIV